MTLGIGYQGKDFALLLTDSMDFPLGVRELPTLDGHKFFWSGDRLVYVLSGNMPQAATCDVSQLGPIGATNKLHDWMRPYNREFDSETGAGFYVLVAGSPLGGVPVVCARHRLGPPRVATSGDVLIVGSRSPRARELGMERNYGELISEVAFGLLVGIGYMIVKDLFEQYGYTGCRTLDDFYRVTPGQVPTIAPPFHVALITPGSTSQRTQQVEINA